MRLSVLVQLQRHDSQNKLHSCAYAAPGSNKSVTPRCEKLNRLSVNSTGHPDWLASCAAFGTVASPLQNRQPRPPEALRWMAGCEAGRRCCWLACCTASCTDMDRRLTAAAHSMPTALAMGLGGRCLGCACLSGTQATSSAESELWSAESPCECSTCQSCWYDSGGHRIHSLAGHSSYDIEGPRPHKNSFGADQSIPSLCLGKSGRSIPPLPPLLPTPQCWQILQSLLRPWQPPEHMIHLVPIAC